MNSTEVGTAQSITASQLALKDDAERLLQTVLESHGAEGERLALALNSIPSYQLEESGATAVLLTARLCKRCSRPWEALRLLSHFEAAMRALGNSQLNFRLCVGKARACLLTGNVSGAIINLASGLPDIKSGIPAITITEMWLLTAWVWREAGLTMPTLAAAKKMLEMETRTVDDEGVQALAANGIIETHAAMGNVDRAIKEGLQFARNFALSPPTSASSAGRLAVFYLSLVRLLVSADRLNEADEILEFSKACSKDDWTGAGQTVALIVATCAKAVGDSATFDQLTQQFCDAPGIEDAMRQLGRRVRASVTSADKWAFPKQVVAEQRAMRAQKIEQLVAHVQWDVECGACELRKAKMSRARAATWVLENALATAALRFDGSGQRMAVAGNIARQIAQAAPQLDVDPDVAEVAGRLAMIGYMFVPSRLLLAPPEKNSKSALAVSFLASQGARKLMSAFDDVMFDAIGRAAHTLRTRANTADRTRLMAPLTAPLLAKLMTVAQAAAEACIGKESGYVVAAEMRTAVSRAARWLDPEMFEMFSTLSDAVLDKAGRCDDQVAQSVKAHGALMQALAE